MSIVFRDKIKLKPGITKKQGDVALLLAHNQGTSYIQYSVCTLYILRPLQCSYMYIKHANLQPAYLGYGCFLHLSINLMRWLHFKVPLKSLVGGVPENKDNVTTFP